MTTRIFTENSTAQNASGTLVNGVTEDCGMAESDPTSNQDSFGGFETSRFGSGDHQNIIIVFDTSDIPDTDIITSVTLYMYMHNADATHTINAYEMLRTGWGETTNTWNTYDGSTSWTTGGCRGAGTDRSSSTIGSSSITTTNEYKSFSFPVSIVDASGSTYIVMEMDSGEGESGDVTQWRDSEDTDGQRPELVVVHSAAAAPAEIVGHGLLNSLKLNRLRLIG